MTIEIPIDTKIFIHNALVNYVKNLNCEDNRYAYIFCELRRIDKQLGYNLEKECGGI